MTDRLAEIRWQLDEPCLGAGRMFMEVDVRWLVAEVERERIENTHLREAFVTMERGYNLAAAVLDGAGVEFEDPRISYTTIQVDRAAWQAWRGRQA